jgi:hypothetical protein
MSATFLKKLREMRRDRDKTLSLSVFVAVRWYKKEGLIYLLFKNAMFWKKTKMMQDKLK